MCRWLAYSGDEIAPTELIFKTQYSLIDQSLSARSSVSTTHGDGFGVGWYDHCSRPGLYKSTQPAWNDPNLREICGHAMSPMFLAHVRASTGTPVQQSNCHPFRFGTWLFVHNGVIHGFGEVKRALTMAIAPGYFTKLEGATDSELMFYMALTFGLENDIRGGFERMVGFVETTCREYGIQEPVQMTLGIADGRRLCAVRYSSSGQSPSLFHSRSLAALREIAPPEAQSWIARFSDDARAIVSEPLTNLLDPWIEVPESSFVTVENGEVECVPFRPEAP